MSTSPDFTGTRLSFSLAGAGLAYDPATASFTLDAARLAEGLEVTVATSGPDGAGPSFRLALSLLAKVEPPRLLAAPALAGSGTIGLPVAVEAGGWEGAEALAFAWCRDGAAIEGATGERYTPVAEDDRRALSCRVTATNAAGSTAAETAPLLVAWPAPLVVAALADVALPLDGGPGRVEAAPAFAGEGLGFAVAGGEAEIDAVTGVVSLPAATLGAARVTVTAHNSGGAAEASFEARVVPVAPARLEAPTLAGSGRIGAAVTVAPGSWSGAPAPELGFEWRRNGVAISGATGASYTPVAADDRTALTCRVTATNAGGSAAAETAALAVTRVAPVASGPLADVEAPLDSGPLTVAAAAAFDGEGLAFAVSGAGATIDAAGVVTLPTAALLTAVPVTVTASNSGGSATARFRVSVVAVAPALVSRPTLAGSGKIGAAVSVAAGSWSGKPAPVTALAWCRDGVEIAGATGASYTPVAADDRAALTCRVTATNAGGSAVAASAALAVTRVAPVASGLLADVTLTQGAAAGSVAAAAAFTGGGLSYAVSGAGATIDAATGVVSLPTAVLRSAAAVTVTASNSGGAASTGFRVTVTGREQGITVSSRAALLAAITASVAGDVIRIAPGVYDRFIWPKNTSHKLTLTPADLDNPPILRGIWISQNPDDFFPAQSPTGTWAKNLTIDGLRFQAELMTRMQQADGKIVNITGEDGRGYGWRAGYSYPGVTSLGESSGFVGIKLGSGCSDILIQNCLFEQFAKGLNVQCDRATVQHCEFSEMCEDAVIIWGGEDLTFQYNIWSKSRGVSLQAAQAYGWKNDEPVHQDFFQIACNSASQFCTRLNISYNVINDDSERVHGLLLNNAYVGGSTAANLQGSRHRNVTVENNFLKVTHTTALQLTNVVGLTARRNKVIRSKVVAGSTKNDVAIIVGAWGSLDAQNCDDITVQNNVSRKYKGPWKDSWVWTGNLETNDEAVLPPGWVEIRPELVKSGRKAGRYGNPG